MCFDKVTNNEAQGYLFFTLMSRSGAIFLCPVVAIEVFECSAKSMVENPLEGNVSIASMRLLCILPVLILVNPDACFTVLNNASTLSSAQPVRKKRHVIKQDYIALTSPVHGGSDKQVFSWLSFFLHPARQ